MPKPARWIAGIVGVLFAVLAIGAITVGNDLGFSGVIGVIMLFGGLYAVVLLGLAKVF
ncbi:hypothetical protein [Prosthecodimorpha staleyi]|uniref:Uncharacterized protein n=1 Tax=Prosthecodimorpha staleyi TaxID=2840188 RepID=A0A947DA46_9HYPH|nr:hypothetical protein [Prosthecodimorpha staleyi]MBT9292691.1 hypothetical protein [Prosthecodimorpha staleyi]